jgi:hypothetical protein
MLLKGLVNGYASTGGRVLRTTGASQIVGGVVDRANLVCFVNLDEVYPGGSQARVASVSCCYVGKSDDL